MGLRSLAEREASCSAPRRAQHARRQGAKRLAGLGLLLIFFLFISSISFFSFSSDLWLGIRILAFVIRSPLMRSCCPFSSGKGWGFSSQTVATCPFAAERGEAHECAFQRRKDARSRHQRLFVENVGKTEGNRSKWKFYVRELYLRLRKVLAPLTFVSKDNNLFFRIGEIVLP